MSIITDLWTRIVGKEKRPLTHAELFPKSVNADVRFSFIAHSTVSRLDYRPSEKVSLALNALKEKGIEEYVLFGGAIRDDILNVPISDFDTMIHIKELLDPNSIDVNDTIARQSAIEHALAERGFEDINLKKSYDNFDQYNVRIGGVAEYDLLVHPRDFDATTRVGFSDASISGVIYTSNGECYADRLFTNGLVNKVYLYAKVMNPDRFEKLASKVDGLVVVEEADAMNRHRETVIATDNPRIPQVLPF